MRAIRSSEALALGEGMFFLEGGWVVHGADKALL